MSNTENQIVGNKSSHHGGPGPYLMTAETLKDNSVVNSAGEDLGHITDILLDVQFGRIAYAVLTSGGVLGVGSKLFAIPWEALKLDTDHQRFILEVEQVRLKQAPGFDKDHWPTRADYQWASTIHSYYGYQPYWEGE